MCSSGGMCDIIVMIGGGRDAQVFCVGRAGGAGDYLAGTEVFCDWADQFAHGLSEVPYYWDWGGDEAGEDAGYQGSQQAAYSADGDEFVAYYLFFGSVFVFEMGGTEVENGLFVYGYYGEYGSD